MSNSSQARVHAQTAEMRLGVMDDIDHVATKSSPPDEPWQMPGPGNEGLTPFIAGRVYNFAGLTLTSQELRLFGFWAGKEGPAYVVERPALLTAEPDPNQPDWHNWSICTLTSRRGLRQVGSGDASPQPMTAAVYGSLRKQLNEAFFTRQDTQAALDQMSAAGLDPDELGAYCRRQLQFGRRRTRLGRRAGAAALGTFRLLEDYFSKNFIGIFGLPAPMPLFDDRDPDTLS